MTATPLAEALPQLITERGLTMRGLARRCGVDPAHLSRVIRAHENKKASSDLARRVALALDLPQDYFPEYREGSVIDWIRGKPELRDELYRRVSDARRSLPRFDPGGGRLDR